MSLVVLIIALGVPIIITILLIRHFGKKPNLHEDYLLEKIRELEARVEVLEEKPY